MIRMTYRIRTISVISSRIVGVVSLPILAGARLQVSRRPDAPDVECLGPYPEVREVLTCHVGVVNGEWGSGAESVANVQLASLPLTITGR